MELAQALRVSRQAISEWETGEATPSLENLKSLCQLYQIPLDELLGKASPRHQRRRKRMLSPWRTNRRKLRQKQACRPQTTLPPKRIPGGCSPLWRWESWPPSS